jgi:hypothetical protein
VPESGMMPGDGWGGKEDTASSIDVLPSKDSTECAHVRVNGRKHRVEEKVCQSGILGRKCEQKINSYASMEII